MKIMGEPARWENMRDLIADRCSAWGDKMAYEVDGVAITYTDLDRKTDALAGQLAALGVFKGDVVATFMHNRLEQVLVWFACCKLGAVWSPVNASLVGDDLSYTVRNTEARIVIVGNDLITSFEEAKINGLAVYFAGESSVKPYGWKAFDNLLSPGLPVPAVDIGPGDPCTIIYTGGTTGRPKGVVLPHFSYIVGGHRYRFNLSIVETDVYYTVMQLYHIGAQAGAVVCGIMWGIPGYIDRKFSASQFISRCRETGATVIDPVSTMYGFLLAQPPSDTDRDHKIRISMDSSGHMPWHVMEEYSRRFNIQLCASYAQSECGSGYMVTCPPGPNYRPRALGKTWGWGEVAILDDNGERLPTDAVGEIVLRPAGPHEFMIRYHNQPDATLEKFKGFWLHTGDLGRIDEDGYLWFAGRQAHWLRRRGENVSCIEVETALSRYPGVAEVCVVGTPSEHGEEEVRALIRTVPGTVLDPAAIIEWAAQDLAAFKLPRFIGFVEDFPRSATKREIERPKVKAYPLEGDWDREKYAPTRGKSSEKVR